MIKKEELLNGIAPVLKEGVVYLDWFVGGMFDVQIVASNESKDLDALIAQGGKISAVNEAREKAGLHRIGMNVNNKVISEAWIEKIRKGDGIVLKMMNGARQIKVNKIFEAAIDEAKNNLQKLDFDLLENPAFDTILIYVKDQESKKEKKKADPEKTESNV